MNLSMMMDQGGLVADHVIYVVEEIARAGGGVSVLVTAKAKDRLNDLLSNPNYKRLRQPRVLQVRSERRRLRQAQGAKDEDAPVILYCAFSARRLLG